MADALSKPDPTLWRLRPRAPMPGTVLVPARRHPRRRRQGIRVRARHHRVLDVRGAARRQGLRLSQHLPALLLGAQLRAPASSSATTRATYAAPCISPSSASRTAMACAAPPSAAGLTRCRFTSRTAPSSSAHWPTRHERDRHRSSAGAARHAKSPSATTFAVDIDAMTPAFSQRTPHVPAIDRGYRFDPGTTMAILSGFAGNRRVVIQGRHGTGKSTHIEQVAARLNWPLRARQSRQPHQPHRPDRQGRHRAARRQAGHRIPRRHPALGLPAAGGAGVRRIRCRATRRDVRHPARAGGRGPPHHPRPEQGAAAAPLVPHLRHRQHDRARRRQRPLSRHAAAQPGAARPLEHRGAARLPAGGRGGRRGAVQGAVPWPTRPAAR